MMVKTRSVIATLATAFTFLCSSVVPVFGFNQSPAIPLFRTTLRGVGPGGIPVALPDPKKAPVTGVTHYTIDIRQFKDQILPEGWPRTTFWGYNPTIGLGGNTTPTLLGGIIIGQKGTPIQITFRNKLAVENHILPVDTTIPGSEPGVPVNRTSVHLHGGLVPWISDGGPNSWFGTSGDVGPSFLNNQVLNPGANPGEAEYYYPMNQSARFMWYHDHAMGITRLNAYAGVASGLIIRDNFEKALIQEGLPEFIEDGGNEIPLVIQDKIFVGKHIATSDPTWTGLKDYGSLWYAHTYDPSRWDLLSGGKPLPDPSAVPEFFADTMLVNGTAYPKVTVQARRYRLRLLNACNARFLNLQLYLADSSKEGITLDASGNPTNAPFLNHAAGDTPNFLQIGTEGGFLSKPAMVASNVPLVVPAPVSGAVDPSLVQKSLLVGPAERPDLLVDFSDVQPGTDVVLYNDAPAPFPMGDPVNDYFPGLNNGNSVNLTTQPGFGPNTRVLMRFHVEAALPPKDPTLKIGTATNLARGIDPNLVPWESDRVPPAVAKRFLTLNEYHDDYGRLIQILGNEANPFGSPYDMMATYLDYGRAPGQSAMVMASRENVKDGDTEVWEIYNTTGDVHPMHFHLVNVQVINRQGFDSLSYPYVAKGPVIPPDPNERGWKETVLNYPGTVTRVIMKFDLSKAGIISQEGKPIEVPPSPRTGGAEYVCIVDPIFRTIV
ncbi:multicopper oxidase family protein [Geomesophilobacter sediminis]|uniref:Multicopper oxidase domain-containing protein n=1 Tax=Geomesophilobacter sediminis TaxID=2798584 RepID=A0A8J7JKT7_9BACT|nr:multicopper oxidase domain-containing protein [Geomesophilobacter sediminis]MBJ6724175.1 multicopper oxidase domain-containing protein [Geomesophilobacter sediminis]